MSIGWYLATNREFPEQKSQMVEYSLNRLLAQGLTKKEVIEQIDQLGFDISEISPDELVFAVIPDDDVSFEVTYQDDPGIVAKYAPNQRMYAINMLNKQDLAQDFTAYLEQNSQAFCLFKIQEDHYEPDYLKTKQFSRLELETIRKFFDDDQWPPACYIFDL